jgi:hypothetical protein
MSESKVKNAYEWTILFVTWRDVSVNWAIKTVHIGLKIG